MNFQSLLLSVLTRFWRHRWAFLVPIATLVAGAAVVVHREPDYYEARVVCRIRELQSGSVTGGLPEERIGAAWGLINTTPERLFAAPTLASVTSIFVPGARDDDPGALETARAGLAFERLSPSSFALRARTLDPQQAADAANKLMDTFLENERRAPWKQAESARNFRERQLNEATASRTKAAEELSEFDKSHAETLPQQLIGLHQQLDKMRVDMQILRARAAQAKASVAFFEEQLARRNLLRTAPGAPVEAGPGTEETDLLERLKSLDDARKDADRRLMLARTRYTEKHPAVLGLLKEVGSYDADIARTRDELNALRTAPPPPPPPTPLPGPEGAPTAPVAIESEAVRLTKDLKARAEEELKLAEADVATHEAQMKPVEEMVAKMPHTEAARRPLERALAEAENRRQEALRLYDTASMYVEYMRVSDASAVTSYAVQSWAGRPTGPAGPARGRTMAIAAGIGGALAYAWLWVRKRLRLRTITRIEDIYELLPQSLVVPVPLLGSGQRRSWVGRLPWADFGYATWVLLCGAVTAAAWAVHARHLVLPPLLQTVFGGPA